MPGTVVIITRIQPAFPRSLWDKVPFQRWKTEAQISVIGPVCKCSSLDLNAHLYSMAAPVGYVTERACVFRDPQTSSVTHLIASVWSSAKGVCRGFGLHMGGLCVSGKETDKMCPVCFRGSLNKAEYEKKKSKVFARAVLYVLKKDKLWSAVKIKQPMLEVLSHAFWKDSSENTYE